MTRILEKWPKQPDDIEDYDVSFVDYLAARSDTGASHTVAISPSGGATILASTLTAGVVKVWVTGGVSGTEYKITVTLTTTGGRVKQAEVSIKVKEV